jgi:excisionase family DNA binding protein
MSVWEAATALDVPVGQVYALCEVGTLAYVRPGRQIRILRSAVGLLDAGV